MGCIFQNISFAVTTPVYLFLHLLTSPTARPYPGPSANRMLLISFWDLTILPLSVTVGYIIPSFLMVLWSPEIVSPGTHQNYIAFWQGFPLWSVATHWLLRSVCQCIGGKASTHSSNKHPPTPLSESYLNTAKHIYRFSLTLCIITHIPVLLIALLPLPAAYQQ